MIQGRLTLQSGSPIHTSDQIDKDRIFYAPYIGPDVSIYDGSTVQSRPIITSDTDAIGQELILDSNSGHTGYHEPYQNFDVFAYWNGSATKIGTGPKWNNVYLGRGTGAGTTELTLFKGIWTNKNTITLRFGTGSADTVSVSATQATYLGSIFIQGNGLLSMPFKPAAISGGSQNILCMSNAYNRVTGRAICRDSTTSWTYSSGSVRSANNSDANRIWWLEGLPLNSSKASFQATITPIGTTANAYTCGVGFQQKTNLGFGVINQGAFVSSTSYGTTINGYDVTDAAVGLRWVQALEQSTTAGMNIYANGFSALELEFQY